MPYISLHNATNTVLTSAGPVTSRPALALLTGAVPKTKAAREYALTQRTGQKHRREQCTECPSSLTACARPRQKRALPDARPALSRFSAMSVRSDDRDLGETPLLFGLLFSLFSPLSRKVSVFLIGLLSEPSPSLSCRSEIT